MKEIDFKDRVPNYPGRVTLSPVEGQPNTFDMERADDPLVVGTLMNKVLFQSITHSRLTGRFYEPTVASELNTEYSDAVYNNAFEIESGVPSQWTVGQRITVFTPEIENTIMVAENTLNGVKINTILQGKKRYELVYNGTSFDVKEL